MTDYAGSTPIPGLSASQISAVELALSMIDGMKHDGLNRLIAAELGDASSYSDQQVAAAVRQALVHGSGIYIPAALLPAPLLNAAAAQLASVKAAFNATAALSLADLHNTNVRGRATLAAGGALQVDAVVPS